MTSGTIYRIVLDIQGNGTVTPFVMCNVSKAVLIVYSTLKLCIEIKTTLFYAVLLEDYRQIRTVSMMYKF